MSSGSFYVLDVENYLDWANNRSITMPILYFASTRLERQFSSIDLLGSLKEPETPTMRLRLKVCNCDPKSISDQTVYNSPRLKVSLSVCSLVSTPPNRDNFRSCNSDIVILLVKRRDIYVPHSYLIQKSVQFRLVSFVLWNKW